MEEWRSLVPPYADAIQLDLFPGKINIQRNPTTSSNGGVLLLLAIELYKLRLGEVGVMACYLLNRLARTTTTGEE